MTIEEKAKAYDKALERAKQLTLNSSAGTNYVEMVFPELVKSEDETIKELIYNLLTIDSPSAKEIYSIYGKSKEDIVAWLEKQKPATGEEIPHTFTDEERVKETINFLDNRYKPKFKIGDWIVEPREGEPNGLWHIEKIINAYYWDGKIGVCIEFADKNFHLWTIQDAKDGDVLTCESEIHGKSIEETGIVKQFVGKYGGCSQCFECYAYIDWDGIFRIGEYMGSKNIIPATQSQKETLFKAMADAGYEWDIEKKELKKMEASILLI